jgi:hypothetical protein
MLGYGGAMTLFGKLRRHAEQKPGPASSATLAPPPPDIPDQELTDAQQRVLHGLRSDGIAVVPFAQLFDEPGLWDELRSDMEQFVRDARERLAQGERQEGEKEYLIRRYERRKGRPVEPGVLPADGPWLRFAAGDTLLSIVNAYRGGATRLVDFDQWYTIPYAVADHERIASQEWHRDPEDQHVVKAFLYFSDVDEEAGPFEYVRRSVAGMTYGDLWPWVGGRNYPPPDEVEREIPASERLRITGPEGTLVVCDTSGLHRGGYCTGKPRVLTMHTYVRRHDRPRRFEVDWSSASGVSAQTRYALS